MRLRFSFLGNLLFMEYGDNVWSSFFFLYEGVGCWAMNVRL